MIRYIGFPYSQTGYFTLQTLIMNPVVEVIQTSLFSFIQQKTSLYTTQDEDKPFMICDTGEIYKKCQLWERKLPRVKPFYAVKCNDDHVAVKVMADMGLSFDCASKNEIKKLLDLGVHPDRIIYAHPCKQRSFLKYAAEKGVSMMTFDNESELHKIKELYPEARLLIRILPPVSKAKFNLGIKFGCPVSETEQLLVTARNLDLSVIGVSFHVGSNCMEAEAFSLAIESSRKVFDIGLKAGHNMTLLDIGGGYPGQETPFITFREIADAVTVALNKYFPVDEGVDVIAEPGRFFVESAFTVCVCVIAKRAKTKGRRLAAKNDETKEQKFAEEESGTMYYVSDGLHGSFGFLHYEHDPLTKCTIKDYGDKQIYRCSVWGPTCDGNDCILKTTLLPELEIGDWIYFRNMGAYSNTCSTDFNGMPKPAHFYICAIDVWEQIYPEAVKNNSSDRK